MKFKRILILFLLPLLLCSCGDKNENVTASVTKVNCEQKNRLVGDGATLIDVRSAAEFDEGHLEGAINISVESIATKIEQEIPDKNTKIVLYCRSGNRSATAAEALINKGYTNVYDLGGMSNCVE